MPTSAKTNKKKLSSIKRKITAPPFGNKSVASTDDVPELLRKTPKAAFPSILKPMLASLVDKPIDETGWIYEVKWDGYRALAFSKTGKVELKSRNDKSFNDKFYPVTKALETWGINAILDGEIIVADKNGISNFSKLQNWRSEADGELLFYVFDILWYENKDLKNLPLIDRRKILKSIIPQNSIIRLSEDFQETAVNLFNIAKRMGLEGIIAKRMDSVYSEGNRSKNWLKIKANKRQEMVIGGYTLNDNSIKPFSSLLVGVYENKYLVFTGKVGTGFNIATQKEMMRKFKSLVVKKCPFTTAPDINKPSRFRPNPPNAEVTWLKPLLVCEVSFTEMTTEGIMRHPSFEGIRIDKDANEVVREIELKNKKLFSKLIKPLGKTVRKTLLNPTEATQVKKINGKEIKFTNLHKLYWPQEKITKRDLLNYYYQAAPFILPYLKDRPQSMLRHPDGITGFSFFYKNIKGKGPDWLNTYKYHSEGDGEDKEYLVAKDEASLLYMASLGSIEMNPWHSRVQSEDHPDWCIIDLDPAKNTFNQVIEAANVCKDILNSLGIEGYPKTSGSTGIHIYIPLGAKYSYEQSKEFARVIATLIHRELPKFTSIERAVKNRKGKMYIDFLQNRPQATVSAPYSVRPKPGATVSMPLQWHEVKKGLKMTDFTIHNAIERMNALGDLFKPVLGKGINLEKAIKKFELKEK